jgi:peroxiredoxin Q/BCP
MNEPLAVGATAPDFTLPSHLGDSITLSAVLAQGKNVVVFFYPLDWTPV